MEYSFDLPALLAHVFVLSLLYLGWVCMERFRDRCMRYYRRQTAAANATHDLLPLSPSPTHDRPTTPDPRHTIEFSGTK